VAAKLHKKSPPQVGQVPTKGNGARENPHAGQLCLINCVASIPLSGEIFFSCIGPDILPDTLPIDHPSNVENRHLIGTMPVNLDPVDLLCQLVNTPSVNPMGGPLSGPTVGEGRLTELLHGVLQQLGLVVERQEVAPGRENLIGRLDGDVPPEQGGGLILLDAHQDTVPVDGMTIDPFNAELREGRIYGRGACDVKGGMAAILAAVARLAQQRPAGMPTIVVAFTVNEEHGFTGALELAKLWTDRSGGIIPRPPDAALVAEPTDLNVVVAHKGVARWNCHTRGRAAHSARPDAGANAIYAMGHVIGAIEHYAAEIVGSHEAPCSSGQELCPATVNVGTIHGGTSVNTVPERCTIEIDRRLLPGEDPDDARRHLIDFIDGRLDQQRSGTSIEHDPLNLRGLALSDAHNGPLADRLLHSIGQVTANRRKMGVPYGTNAAIYAATGVPSVVFGPGSIDQAHTADEWIDVESLNQATKIFDRFARMFS
jgi:acetylornithine deacetylase/succinyl-diaminopimelate desuccinylase family protein